MFVQQCKWIFCIFVNILAYAAGQSHHVQQSFRVVPEDIEVVSGDDVTMYCEVDNQMGQAQWTQNGFALGFNRSIPGFPRYSIIGDEGSGIHNFLITNVSLDDDGEYQCQVTPHIPSHAIRDSASMTVLLPPTSIQLANQSNNNMRKVKAGIEITLECNAKNAKPAPKIVWYRGKEIMTQAQTDTESDSKLPHRKDLKSVIKITPTNQDNNVAISCRTSHPALNDAQEFSDYVILDVHYEPGNPEISGYTEGEVFQAGNTKTIKCKSRLGNPLPEVFWYKNGQQIDTTFKKHKKYTINDHQFVVDPSDNNAKYECHVQNVMTAHPKKLSIVLKVYFPPTSVNINGPNEVSVGDIISLTCSAINSNPPADINLLINNVSPDGVSSRQSKTDQGGYTTISNLTGYEVGPTNKDILVNCYANNQPHGTSKLATKTIIVLRPPNPPIILGNDGTMLRLNERRRLSCRSEGGNPLPDLKWFKGDKEIPSETLKESGSSISNLDLTLDESDNGAQYRCEANNSATPTPLSVTTNLTVMYPPNAVKVSISPSVPQTGNEVTLTCKTSPAYPRANISWWSEDGFEVAGSYGKQRTGLYLGIITSYSINVNVTSEMNGKVYTCEAGNGYGHTTHDAITLNVEYPPIITIEKKSFEVSEGSDVHIEAEATGNPSSITFIWRKGVDVVKDGSSLNLTEVTKEMGGVYTVEAANSVGSVFKNVTVKIKYAPIITETTHRKEVMKGSNQSLECHFKGSPSPDVEWKRKNYNMKRTETVTYSEKSILIIRDVQASDSGFFACHATNEVGETIMPNISLIVTQKPEADTQPKYQKAAAEVGGKARLLCRFKASPAVSITWYTRDNEPISKDIHPGYDVEPVTLVDNLITYESVLVIKNVTIKDHGDFFCQARNSLGLVRNKIYLEGTSKPDPPTDVKVLNVTHNSVHLTWIPGFDGGLSQGYVINYHQIDSHIHQSMKVYPENITNFWVIGLSLGTTYRFTAIGINTKGRSSPSRGEVQATTLSSPPLTEVEMAISRVLADKGNLPKVVTLSVSAIGGVLVIINVALVGCVLHRRRNRNKDSAASSDKGSSKSTTIEMYAPSSYTGTVTGETLSSISEKSRESYAANDDSADDYEVDAPRGTASSTYLIEQLEPPPQYASRAPPHILPPPASHNNLHMDDPYDQDIRRNHYNASLDHVPGYGTLGRRGPNSTSGSDHYSVGNGGDAYPPSVAPHYPSYIPHSNTQQPIGTHNHSHQHNHYNGSLRRNPPHKLHFPKDYIRNGSMGNIGAPISPSGSGHNGETSFSGHNISPTRANPPLSTFSADGKHLGNIVPIEQRGHLV